MEILFLVALILLNGVFAMSEIALVTARRARLARLAEEGDGSAAVAMRLHDEPTRFLSTVQIGITSIGLLSGIVGEAAVADPFAVWLVGWGLDAETASIVSTALVVAGITYVAIVVGELVPKRIGQLNPEGIARLVARPMNWLSLLTRPFVRLLSLSTESLLRLLGQRKQPGQSVTEEEIRAMLQEGSEAGVIEQQEHDMVRNVFRLDQREIGTLMIPRADIEYLDLEEPLERNLARVAASAHSRFPLCRGGLTEVVGVVNAKQLLHQALRGGVTDLAAEVQPAVFVPETLNGLDLLRHFRGSATPMVLVVDEYGDVQGLVTLHNVLETVTGELTPADAEDAWAVQREDGSWLLDGLIPIPELKDRLGIKSMPDEARGRYHTLSGLMMWLLERVPRTGDTAVVEDWRLEVVDLDGRRVDKVLATPLAKAAVAEGGIQSVPDGDVRRSQ